MSNMSPQSVAPSDIVTFLNLGPSLGIDILHVRGSVSCGGHGDDVEGWWKDLAMTITFPAYTLLRGSTTSIFGQVGDPVWASWLALCRAGWLGSPHYEHCDNHYYCAVGRTAQTHMDDSRRA